MYIKCVKISSGTAEGKFQIGQAGKDDLKNLFRFKGVSKNGTNVWVLVAAFRHDTNSYKWRYGSKGYANDLKRMRAALKDKPLESTFKGKYGYEKDIRTKYYNVNRKSRILLDPAKQ
jgi:hypothetical protein